jgi:type VI secretion system protein ImpK
METPRQQNSVLTRHFREFYREAARLKQLVEMGTPVYAYDYAALTGTEDSQATGAAQHLLAILERQALEAGRSGGAFGVEVYREAQFIMAALADEVFLHLNWDGRQSWPLLESKLYQTHHAGEAFFVRLDRLLQRRDPYYFDLASVYFMALALGFQGKYRNADPTGQLEEYRKHLFNLIYRRRPELYETAVEIMPQASQFTVDRAAALKLPSPKSWLWLAGGVVLCWLLVSQVLWRSVSTQVSCLICQVLKENCVCDTGTGQ